MHMLFRFINKMLYGRWLGAVIIALFLPALSYAADCSVSPYAGRVSLNEFFKDKTNQSNDPDDFVEIKLLDSTITEDIFSSWEIQVCERDIAGNNNDSDGCSGTISVSDFTEKTLPWIVLRNNDIGNYINFKTGYDAYLIDSLGNVIDYLTVDGYGEAENQLSCTVPIAQLPFDNTSSAPGASDKFVSRKPDGTGDWQGATSASATPTEDDSNDYVNGNPAPVISVENVVVSKGDTATFTLTLGDAPKSYDVTIDYQTQNGTAVSGTDYTASSGTATIPAGSYSTTVSVSTISGSSSGTVYFYLYLSNPVNATLSNHYPTGTILADATGEWHLDESSWDGTTDEVTDFSGSDNHGEGEPMSWSWFSWSYTGPSTVTGYLCNAGQFDGSNDYVSIPHSSSLNGSDNLTYMAWIKPDNWTSGINQIMAKSVHGGGSGRAQMGIFSESGVLKGRAETAAGRIEVTTSLPSTGSWTHVALVFSGDQLRLYINGDPVSSTSFSSTTLEQNSDPLLLSKRYGSDEYYFDGLIDEVVVMPSALPASFMSQVYSNYTSGLNWDGTARSCAGGPHHIELEHDGSALTCNPETVTIRACSDANCNSAYTGDVTVTLSPSGWVNGDTFTFSGGETTRKLRHTTAEDVTLAVTSSSPAATTSEQCYLSGSPGTCTLTFHDSGFAFDVPTLTSCSTSSAVTISAVRKDDTTEQCVPAFSNRTETINFWSTYSNPATGTKAVSINGTDVSTTSPGTGVELTFDANGESNFTVTYPDAGQMQLDASFTGSGDESGLIMTGNDTFVTVPAKLLVYSGDTNAACPSGDVTCSVFKKAGDGSEGTADSFNLSVRAACSDDTVTPNFIHNGITIGQNLVAPAGGSAGTLSVGSIDITDADNGEATVSQSITEVGVYTFTASSGTQYLGENLPVGLSENIGRFVPDRLSIAANTPVFADSCTGFTYQDQLFNYAVGGAPQLTVTALNTAGNTTNNYGNTFWQLNSDLSTRNYTDQSGSAATLNINPDADNASLSGDSDYDGQAQLDLDDAAGGDDFTYQRTAEEAPFAANVDLNLSVASLTDSDGVCYDSDNDGTCEPYTFSGITGTQLRFGRLQLFDAFGPQTSNLNMSVVAQYHNGTEFVENSDDTCSVLPLDTDINLANWTDNLQAGETSVDSIDPMLSNGIGQLTLLAPGLGADGNDGSVTASMDLSATTTWLRFDWDNADGDGNPLTGIDDPSGTATFGMYRGDDRFLLWREAQ